MPKLFEQCVRAGGKVVTKNIGKDKYVYGCRDKKGKWHWGEIHKKKKEKK